MYENQQPQSYAGTHKRKVKAFTIMRRVFLPIGIIFLVLGVTLLAVGIPGIIQGLKEMEAAGSCVQTSRGYRCEGAGTATFALGVFATSFGGTHFIIGLPLFILAIVFRSLSRAARAEDEAHGIDYSDFPYGN